jgi:hypothetical protein
LPRKTGKWGNVPRKTGKWGNVPPQTRYPKGATLEPGPFVVIKMRRPIWSAAVSAALDLLFLFSLCNGWDSHCLVVGQQRRQVPHFLGFCAARCSKSQEKPGLAILLTHHPLFQEIEKIKKIQRGGDRRTPNCPQPLENH